MLPDMWFVPRRVNAQYNMLLQSSQDIPSIAVSSMPQPSCDTKDMKQGVSEG